MGSVIGELLPLAIGVAISPIPIIAVILTLLTKRATGNSASFLVGWVAGIVLVTTVILAVVGQAANTSTDPSTLSSVLKLIFGVLLLSLAAKQWRERPGPGESGAMPNWMDAIESFTPAKSQVDRGLLELKAPLRVTRSAAGGDHPRSAISRANRRAVRGVSGPTRCRRGLSPTKETMLQYPARPRRK
jgi:hypothetical protein